MKIIALWSILLITLLPANTRKCFISCPKTDMKEGYTTISGFTFKVISIIFYFYFQEFQFPLHSIGRVENSLQGFHLCPHHSIHDIAFSSSNGNIGHSCDILRNSPEIHTVT
jgi:hypothetical protein